VSGGGGEDYVRGEAIGPTSAFPEYVKSVSLGRKSRGLELGKKKRVKKKNPIFFSYRASFENQDHGEAKRNWYITMWLIRDPGFKSSILVEGTQHSWGEFDRRRRAKTYGAFLEGGFLRLSIMGRGMAMLGERGVD